MADLTALERVAAVEIALDALIEVTGLRQELIVAKVELAMLQEKLVKERVGRPA